MHLQPYCQLIKNCFCIKPQEFNLEDINQTCQREGQEIREANRPGVVGASHAPNRGAGRRPGGGPGGEAPGSSWVYENFKVKNEVIEYTIYQLFTK